MDEQGYDENLREGREQQQIIVIGQGDIHIICVVKNVVFTHSLSFVISISASLCAVRTPGFKWENWFGC